MTCRAPIFGAPAAGILSGAAALGHEVVRLRMFGPVEGHTADARRPPAGFFERAAALETQNAEFMAAPARFRRGTLSR